MSAESSGKVRKSKHINPPSRPALKWQGKLMEVLVRRAGLSRLRRCRTASGYGLDRNTRHGRIYCAVLALITI